MTFSWKITLLLDLMMLSCPNYWSDQWCQCHQCCFCPSPGGNSEWQCVVLPKEMKFFVWEEKRTDKFKTYKCLLTCLAMFLELSPIQPPYHIWDLTSRGSMKAMSRTSMLLPRSGAKRLRQLATAAKKGQPASHWSIRERQRSSPDWRQQEDCGPLREPDASLAGKMHMSCIYYACLLNRYTIKKVSRVSRLQPGCH